MFVATIYQITKENLTISVEFCVGKHKNALGIRDEQASMLSKQQVYHAKRHAIACKYSTYQKC